MSSSDSVAKKKGSFPIILFILTLLAIGSSGYAIYNLLLLGSIEVKLRYIVVGLLAVIDFIYLIKLVIVKNSKKKKRHFGYGFLLLFYAGICFSVACVINYLYGRVDNINKDTVVYTSALLTMSDSKANEIKDVNDFKIALLNDKESPDGYIIPQEIIKENNLNDTNIIVEYDNYASMLVDLYADEIDAVFISGNYEELFSGITGYEEIKTDTKIIISKDKEMKKSETSKIEVLSTNKSVTEPFTILLMGIDSIDEVLSKNAVANGDTLILITFNPKTLNATMVSIPRDSYVPIACWPNKAENKITHAAGYGNDCMINTIQNYFGITIDYYAKINFKGLVKLVDAVGGVEVDVPKELCTDNSSRSGTLCIQPGHQVLHGEEALVFARNRKQLANGDFGRAQHQQEIIMALINKMRGISKVSQFTSILDTVSNSLDTNLTTKQILEFYNVAKDIVKKSASSDEVDLINIQQLYLSGTSQMIYDENMKMVLYNYVPNKNSRNDIVQAMKENLELADHKVITKFGFSINTPYEKDVIGSGPYNSGFGTYTLLPNFVGMTQADAQARAVGLGLSVKFEGASGTVVEQSYPVSKRIDKIKDTLVLTLSGSKKDTSKTDDKKVDKDKEKDEDDDDNTGSSDSGNSGGSSTTPDTKPDPTPTPTPDKKDEDNE